MRLCGRFQRLAARKDRRTVVATAVARELAGFWAAMGRLKLSLVWSASRPVALRDSGR